MLAYDPHPLLHPGALLCRFPTPLGELPSPDWLVALLRADAPAPFRPSEALRQAVRNLLRHGGYRPTGRGKPASEYLVRAASEGALGSINPAVDACNAASLHGGLPISVIDLELARPPFRVGLAGPETSYVFNASGQTIRLDGLLCLFDAEGPCATAVKDSQRTKTRAETRATLSIVWGTREDPERTSAQLAWYRELCERAGAAIAPVVTVEGIE